MRPFSARRARNASIALIAAVLIAALVTAFSYNQHNTAFLSGYILLVMMLVLALYNVRKKMPFIPLLRSAAWLQFHLYLGLLTIAVFALHSGLRWPGGVLNTVIFVLYLLVAGSGILGLFLTRAIPARLAVRGEEVIFERIPVFRRQLGQRAQELAVTAVADTQAITLADFYTRRLAHYFAGPRHYWHHLFQSNRPRHALMTEIGAMDRYLNDRERQIIGEMSQLIQAKDDLDYHHALQTTLKGWLFVHIGFTYPLLVLVIVHALMAHLFSGGAR